MMQTDVAVLAGLATLADIFPMYRRSEKYRYTGFADYRCRLYHIAEAYRYPTLRCKPKPTAAARSHVFHGFPGRGENCPSSGQSHRICSTLDLDFRFSGTRSRVVKLDGPRRSCKMVDDAGWVAANKD